MEKSLLLMVRMLACTIYIYEKPQTKQSPCPIKQYRENPKDTEISNI